LIAVDTNILVYAHRRESVWFDKAHDAVRGLAEGVEPWAIPWPCVCEFLAVVTHPRIFATPSPLEVAIGQIDAWLESPSLSLLAEGHGFWEEFSPRLSASRVVGPVVHDARVVALCLAHGIAELWTADRDFGRFPGLRVRNPLVH
jgi:uncharacterized protein